MPAPAATYYLEVRAVEGGSVWLSNGVAGLQRGGVSDLSDDSTCGNWDDPSWVPDTLIF